jgi:hypothetical protein
MPIVDSVHTETRVRGGTVHNTLTDLPEITMRRRRTDAAPPAMSHPAATTTTTASSAHWRASGPFVTGPMSSPQT